jgi:hypothetical protein
MQDSAVDYALTYFTTPKRLLVTWTAVCLTTAKSEPLMLSLLKPNSKLCYDRRSVGQSASMSWFRATTWGPRPDFYYYQTVAGVLMWGALSDERKGLSFTTAAGLASAVILGSETLGIHDHIILSQSQDSPTWRTRSLYLYLPGTEWPS